MKFIKKTLISLILILLTMSPISTKIGSENFQQAYAAEKYGTWIKSGNGKWWYKYYDGSFPIGWASISGKWYYFDSEGWMLTGWQKINNTWYYLKSSGDMATGWQQIGGYWYYLDVQNGDMKTGWQKINNNWYYFNNSGQMLNKWQKINGSWYYLNDSMYENTWVGGYYLKNGGAMASGESLWIDGKYYMFDEDGKVINT